MTERAEEPKLRPHEDAMVSLALRHDVRADRVPECNPCPLKLWISQIA